MKRQLGQQGFGLIGIAIMAVLLLAGGAVAWRVYASRNHRGDAQQSQTATNNASSATTATKTTTATKDPYVGWQSYCSDVGGICFKYPSDWKLNPADSVAGPSTAATITSPSGKVGINFVPNVDGLGGACEPNTCYFEAKEITKPTGASVGNLKVVSGIYTGHDAGVTLPELAVMSDDLITKKGLAVGSNVDVGAMYYLLTNPGDSTKKDKLLAYDTSNTTYKQATDAEQWLSQPEVVTARQILMSVTVR